MFKKKKENIEEIVEEQKPNLPFVLHASDFFFDDKIQFGGYISENQIFLNHMVGMTRNIRLYVREGQIITLTRYTDEPPTQFLVSKLRPFENEIELHEISPTEHDKKDN